MLIYIAFKPMDYSCNMHPKNSIHDIQLHKYFNISMSFCPIQTNNELLKESPIWTLQGHIIIRSMPFKPVNHHCQPIYFSPFSSLAINSSLYHVKSDPLFLSICMKYVLSLRSLFSCDPTSLWYMRVQ